jgi:tyrosine-protein kinase Etk/Wzc
MQAKVTVQQNPDVELDERQQWEDGLQVLFRRWKFILVFSSGVALLTLLIVLLLKDQFTATAIAMPPSQSATSASSLLSQFGGASGIVGSSLGVKTQGDVMVSMLRTQSVEDAVIRRFGLELRYHVTKFSDARKKFQSRSSVSLGSKDGLVTVEVTDRDPKMAADIANGYLNAYQDLSSKVAFTEATQRRMFFEKQLFDAKTDLARAEVSFKDVEKTRGILQVEGQTRALIESAAELRAEIAAKEVELERLNTYMTANNPEYIQNSQELHALQVQLARVGGSDQNPVLLTPNSKVPEANMEYLNKLRDVRYYETISDLLAKQYEIARQDEARQGVGMQVIEAATPPDTKSGPHRILAVVFALLMGFFVSSGWCLLAGRFSKILRVN